MGSVVPRDFLDTSFLYYAVTYPLKQPLLPEGKKIFQFVASETL